MPITIVTESSAEEGDVQFIHSETGELTAEGQVISDFLSHADFSEVTGLAEFAGLFDKATLALGEGDEETEVELLDGALVAEAVDMDDLVGMFDHYVEGLIESAEKPEATLAEKAVVQALLDTFGTLDEASFPKGRGKMRKAWKGNKMMKGKAIRQMLAMRNKGVYVSKGGKNVKGPGYRSGGTTAGKAKVAKYVGKNRMKVAQARKRTGLKAESVVAPADAAIFGLGIPVGQTHFHASPHANAGAAIAEAKKKLGKAGKMPHPPKGGMDTCEVTAGSGHSTGVHEGSRLAGSILTLNEARSGTSEAALKS